LGVITKGVGVLALLMFAPYAFACARGWRNLHAARASDPRWWLGLLAFLVPVLGWALPMLWMVREHHDPAFAHYAHDILLGQTVSRYAHATHHLHPWYYYLGVIAFQWLPLSLALPWAIPGWARRLRRHDARALLPIAWAVIVVVFFSISAGKRNVYILPVMPMVAVALAPLLPGVVRRRDFRIALWLIALLIAAAMLITGALMHTGHLQSLTQRAASALDASPAPLVAMIMGVGAGGVLIALLALPRRALLTWSAFALVLWGAWGLVGYPLLNGYSSARDVMARTASLVPPQDSIALVAWKEQNLLMLDTLGRSSVNWGFRCHGTSSSSAHSHGRARIRRIAGFSRWATCSRRACELIAPSTWATPTVANGICSSATRWCPAACRPGATTSDSSALTIRMRMSDPAGRAGAARILPDADPTPACSV
jgi:4-amino-4-deoxy-L-arabinose transferase-like glycosyltransferase